MVPPPLAVGIIICEKAIIEEGTRQISLVGTIRKMHFSEFPTSHQPFFAFAVLTGGLGNGKMEIVATRLDTDEQVYIRRFDAVFPDRLSNIQVVIPMSPCSFPAPGSYEMSLLVDGDLVGQRRLWILQTEV